MKRATIIICVLFVFLSGCNVRQHRHMRIMDSTKEYVLRNEELIRDAAEWLISHYSQLEDVGGYDTIFIERNDTNQIYAKNYTTEQTEIVKNDACETLLLNDKFFKSITIHSTEDFQTVEFNVKGIGNNAYYNVVFVPSGNMEDVWFYDSRFTYTELDDGFLGTQVDGDNSFFYLPLFDNLFYCESYF